MTDSQAIIVPVKVAGKLIGYDTDKMEAIRTDDVVLSFDLTHANAHFAKFVNAQGKDKIAPAYNLLANYVIPEDQDAFENRIKGDHAAVMSTLGELIDIIMPSVEKTTKNSLSLSS